MAVVSKGWNLLSLGKQKIFSFTKTSAKKNSFPIEAHMYNINMIEPLYSFD